MGRWPKRRELFHDEGETLASTLLSQGLRRALVVALAIVAVLWASAAPAFADEVTEARAVLDAAEARLASITEEYDSLTAEVDSLQGEIDATAKEAMEAQAAVVAGREALGNTAISQYRDGQSASLITILLDSSNFPTFLRNVEYVTRVMNAQADEIEAQKERQAHLEEVTTELNRQKDAQVEAMNALEAKKAEAASVVSAASDRLSDAEAAEAERLAELERQAAALEQANAAVEEPAENPNATTTNRQDVVSSDTTVTQDPNPTPPSSESGWMTGIASAYGGESDPYTKNPGITANGTVCDDNSMGVAIPASTPNCRSYFGRTVEISYGGKTVFATVEDSGGLDGGSRALDLQPGVFKAFGFSTCQEWGLRKVRYRFL